MTGLVVTQPLFKPRCPFCRKSLDLAALVAGPQVCPHCAKPFEATPFGPRSAAADEPATPVHAVPGGANPCAYHPGNAAVDHCDRCGVVMCGLCRIDLQDRQLCAPCFDRLAAGKELRLHKTRGADFRGLAWLSVLGSMTFYLAPILGPAAIVFGILGLRERRREGGDGPGLVSSGVAIGCGSLVTLGGLFFLFAMVALIAAGGKT